MNGRRGKRRILFAFWIVDLCFVVAGSLLPGEVLMRLSPDSMSDKSIHFASYAVLAAPPVILVAGRLRVVATAVLMTLLGLVLEVAQRMVPGRSFDLGDFTANNLGILAGVAAGLLLRGLRFLGPPRSASEGGGAETGDRLGQ